MVRRALIGSSLLFIAISCAMRTSHEQRFIFANPIDALSIRVPTDNIDLSVSALVGNRWTEWEPLEIEKEFDPLLRESNLVMFPRPAFAVRVRGSTEEYEVHPIRVSHEPASVEVAATRNVTMPKILSRKDWGADESFLFTGNETERSDVNPPAEEKDSNGTATASTPSKRVQDCLDAEKNYPTEFKTKGKVTKDAQGRTYRWPLEYSPDVNLLVVHHTALKVNGDARTSVERVRALYAYHTNSRGWGDIGYHYLIDENGQIYEGKTGGDSVVGGHAYCANVGSLGIALLGNFDVEKPTQAQMRALKWLLLDLSDHYKIDPKKNVVFHGKTMPPIIGHKDLVSTDCPGFYVRETLGQIRQHVVAMNVTGPILFPQMASKYADRTSDRRSQRMGSLPAMEWKPTGLSAVGSTDFTVAPGSEAVFTVHYTAGSTGLKRGARLATVSRSVNTIGVWQEMQTRETRVRNELILPDPLRPGEEYTIRIRVQIPDGDGVYSLTIGPLRYTFTAQGRRIRSTDREAVSGERPVVNEQTSGISQKIRIRLGYIGDFATLSLPQGNNVSLAKGSNGCRATNGNANVTNGIVRVDASPAFTTITSWDTATNRFRGVIECRVIDGQLVLINELPLEQYLAGLAEEPDTEPFEKQRAFAIAARSYAAHYLQPEYRKFPGMPYDGDDSAARFQKYGGVTFEERNPAWLKAVESTSGLVLKKDGKIVKTAYFSQDDGRTRAPSEVGWNTFPFAEVFVSKPDPWCKGMQMWGHGVGMSGCGAEGQANEGKKAEEILQYYYPGTTLHPL